jgi:hypothetical protein
MDRIIKGMLRVEEERRRMEWRKPFISKGINRI